MEDKDPKLFEDMAHSSLNEEKYDEAFRFFKRAADIFKRNGNHKQAALCFASAAGCWSIKSGEKTFYNSASSYEEAAKEAKASGDLEYASLLYKYAALNYEKDKEFLSFSDSLYNSKEYYRKFLTQRLFNSKRIHHITKTEEAKGIKGILKRIFSWIMLTLAYFFWGHGERPARTFLSAIFVIFLSALLYVCGVLFKNGAAFKPDFFEALYFSTITFTTVGYGDITPLGLSKVVVMIEALCGISFVPLFVISLTRKYLRI